MSSAAVDGSGPAVLLSYSIPGIKTSAFNTLTSIYNYPYIAVGLLVTGLLLTAWFFIYQVTVSRFERSLLKEVVLSTVASGFLGFGLLFLMLAGGLYV